MISDTSLQISPSPAPTSPFADSLLCLRDLWGLHLWDLPQLQPQGLAGPVGAPVESPGTGSLFFICPGAPFFRKALPHGEQSFKGPGALIVV